MPTNWISTSRTTATPWTGRDQVGIYFLLDVGDGTYLKADSNNFLYLADPIFGSSWGGRIIP